MNSAVGAHPTRTVVNLEDSAEKVGTKVIRDGSWLCNETEPGQQIRSQLFVFPALAGCI